MSDCTMCNALAAQVAALRAENAYLRAGIANIAEHVDQQTANKTVPRQRLVAIAGRLNHLAGR